MGWGDWMTVNRSLERSAGIEIQRRQLQVMHPDQLRGVADSLLCAFHQQEDLLKNAMRRIAELEIKHALMDCQAAAKQLQPKPQLDLLANLRGLVLRWFERLQGTS